MVDASVGESRRHQGLSFSWLARPELLARIPPHLFGVGINKGLPMFISTPEKELRLMFIK